MDMLCSFLYVHRKRHENDFCKYIRCHLTCKFPTLRTVHNGANQFLHRHYYFQLQSLFQLLFSTCLKSINNGIIKKVNKCLLKMRMLLQKGFYPIVQCTCKYHRHAQRVIFTNLQFSFLTAVLQLYFKEEKNYMKKKPISSSRKFQF